jgi:hypothetical protein
MEISIHGAESSSEFEARSEMARMLKTYTWRAVGADSALADLPASLEDLVDERLVKLVGRSGWLHGLVKRPDLNGLNVKLLSYEPKTRRFSTYVPAEQNPILVRLSNLDIPPRQATRCGSGRASSQGAWWWSSSWAARPGTWSR